MSFSLRTCEIIQHLLSTFCQFSVGHSFVSETLEPKQVRRPAPVLQKLGFEAAFIRHHRAAVFSITRR